ncbi:coproporphyrinogen III oxidase [Actinoplanes lobatus]|uniref:Heme chaperone HemW n=1 Tax=Actinoplanes lobatus TaxID=113568 RepID=A0A7W7MG57_9ACTN|nr:radical SAM family heme chaperone HemW [Actinoplanes lobatus]MBB4749044.1 oxygen-independent coproporphyrinogen-3 oxidase [Actinoplanes lobatus]GGN86785.1 coproporphyrinogen III oxidase [Actinoplanes lobatus]GIE42857.1 coproporphyrinogen III oxidase [Actinoplanes lobatus]
MAGALPDGEPVPDDGSLPDEATREVGKDGFAVYVHVPFCASRCGYCDFNTYTASELGGGASREEYADTVLAELALAARVIEPGRVDTVFVGGGTPTLLPAGDLARILEGIDRTWGLAPGAEVTTEANPESVDPAYLRELRRGGFTRISLGMQSAAENVLRVLDRRHTAGRAPRAAAEAREAGFEHVNLDLIYGTPGESPEDFAASLDAVIGAGVDHVSAYALIVEDGTRMAGRMRRGELPYPSDDVAADRYLAAEAALSQAGLTWYEVSNWAQPGGECRHNLLYWTGADWWGLGPGAHSHVGGVRWWNVKHPVTYAKRLAAGTSPGHARETLSGDDRHMEDVMLRVRLREGIPLDRVDATGAARAMADGLLEPGAYDDGRLVLTLRGRLLADAVIRDVV